MSSFEIKNTSSGGAAPGLEIQSLSTLSTSVDTLAAASSGADTSLETSIGSNTASITALNSSVSTLSITTSDLGNYNNLTNVPNLGSAAFSETADFASNAEGDLAVSAVQLSELHTAVSDAAVSDAANAGDGFIALETALAALVSTAAAPSAGS